MTYPLSAFYSNEFVLVAPLGRIAIVLSAMSIDEDGERFEVRDILDGKTHVYYDHDLRGPLSEMEVIAWSAR